MHHDFLVVGKAAVFSLYGSWPSRKVFALEEASRFYKRDDYHPKDVRVDMSKSEKVMPGASSETRHYHGVGNAKFRYALIQGRKRSSRTATEVVGDLGKIIESVLWASEVACKLIFITDLALVYSVHIHDCVIVLSKRGVSPPR